MDEKEITISAVALPELQAIGEIAAVLKPLTQAQRKRVCDYAITLCAQGEKQPTMRVTADPGSIFGVRWTNEGGE